LNSRHSFNPLCAPRKVLTINKIRLSREDSKSCGRTSKSYPSFSTSTPHFLSLLALHHFFSALFHYSQPPTATPLIFFITPSHPSSSLSPHQQPIPSKSPTQIPQLKHHSNYRNAQLQPKTLIPLLPIPNPLPPKNIVETSPMRDIS
jgi:hypothetical protein